MEPVKETPHYVENDDANAKRKASITNAFVTSTAEDQREHNMPLCEGVKEYPYAIAWSVVVPLPIIMEAYDIILFNGLIAQPAFRERYATYYGSDKGYRISGPGQVGTSNATTVGTIFWGAGE